MKTLLYTYIISIHQYTYIIPAVPNVLSMAPPADLSYFFDQHYSVKSNLSAKIKLLGNMFFRCFWASTYLFSIVWLSVL